MNNKKITKYESKAQKVRAKRGNDFESMILKKSSNDWVEVDTHISDINTSKNWKRCIFMSMV